MLHSRQHISNLASILKKKGVENIIISPGSRNAPLIQAFNNVFGTKCISIVDERSAAYFALGLSILSQKPSVMISTSGTATLNYAPAMAEAFHQGVPLIAITADRPKEWIDQQDNQTIHQQGIYHGNCKADFELPLECAVVEDLWYSDRIVNEAYQISVHEKPGSVHINVPLREPLYNELPKPANEKLIEYFESKEFRIPDLLKDSWSNSSKTLIVCGQNNPDKKLNSLLIKLSDEKKAVVVAEPISNIFGNSLVDRPDLVLAAVNDKENFSPELVIYFGGQIVSKRLKVFLRKQNDAKFCLINPNGSVVDTFMNLSAILNANPEAVLKELVKINQNISVSGYCEDWSNAVKLTSEKVLQSLKAIPFSDLEVFSRITRWVTNEDIVFLGNSSVIRYMQMFPFSCYSAYSNRGTSGIDGCLSTSAGIASGTDRNVITILGDLSFLYDSNGLWNKNLPANLKIVVINNQGGGIFEIIDGPSGTSPVLEYFTAHHPVDISMLAKAYGLYYSVCVSSEQLESAFDWLRKTSGASILEIKTPADKSPEIFRNFIKKIQA